MRIALFHNLPAGGAKRHLYEQARLLKQRGHTLALFVPTGALEREYLPLAPLCDGVRVYGAPAAAADVAEPPAAGNAAQAGGLRRILGTTPSLRPLADRVWLWRTARELEALGRLYEGMARDIDAGGYDVLYAHHCRLTLAPDLLRHVARTPAVFCCHDTPRTLGGGPEWPPLTPPGYDEAPATAKRRGWLVSPAQARFADGEERRYAANTRAATVVLANSYYSRECLARVAGVNARVCYPGVDAAFFSPPEGDAPPRERSVLSVGALLPSKRHELVLRAVGALPLSRRPRMEIVGYESSYGTTGLGPEGTRLCRLAGSLGVELGIHKEVSDEALRAAYRRAAVVAVAPYLEPFGLVALEAMACGAAVVGVREGGVRETVRDGETGLLTEAESALLAEAFDRILMDDPLARRLGATARAVTSAEWTWERSVDVAEMHLRRAATEGRAA